MEVKFLQVCDHANISREGKLNLLGIFDVINSRRFPTVHPQMQVVLRFELRRTELGSPQKVEIFVVTPEGKKIFGMEGTFTPQSAAPVKDPVIFHDQIITLNNAVFPEPGRYEVAVHVNGSFKSSCPIDLKTIPEPPNPTKG